MLGKLIKHEWIAVSRIFIPLYIALIAITCFGKLLLSTKLIDAFPEIIQGFFILIYVSMIIFVFIGTTLYLIIRFYKNLYTDEGYLMHTLPVSTNQKIISKTIVAFIYSIISFVLCSASIFFIIVTKEIIKNIPEAIKLLIESCSAQLGVSFGYMVTISVILAIIGALSQIFMCYAAITLGQLLKGHKIIGAIVGYVVLYTISQLFSSILLIAFRFEKFTDTGATTILPKLLNSSTIFSVILCVFYYLITYFMMQKKLNMD